MSRNPALVLENIDKLHELLGENDKNLTLIEELLGVKVFIKGNELFLETDDENKKLILKGIIDQLEDYVKLGQVPGTDLIKAIHYSLDKGKHEKVTFLRDTYIVIPHSSQKVFPKTFNQALYVDAIEKNEMIFAIGPAGTGKTYLAVAMALKYVLTRSLKKLIITRPVVEAGESLGFLPGDLAQKINPYLRPIYDAMESILSLEHIKKLEENGIIEIAPLAYMRGRTLSKSMVILDEAQNTTQEQMKMLLTRIGEGTKTIITGDITQIDLPAKKGSGLLHAISIMKHIKEIHFQFFKELDVVRHPLVRKIVKAYEKDDAKP
ncbi:MAG: PhoH family protein [Spirochaetales bacterium]|nr:PhoH family protein [Spirochaetales bacterium]